MFYVFVPCIRYFNSANVRVAVKLVVSILTKDFPRHYDSISKSLQFVLLLSIFRVYSKNNTALSVSGIGENFVRRDDRAI